MNTFFEVVPDISPTSTGIDGYTDKTSVEQGGTIQFFVSIRGISPLIPAEFTIQISREEENLVPITTLQGLSYEQTTHSDPAVNGCGWEPSLTWIVSPPDPSEPYKSGVYRATLNSGSASSYFWFIVKAANPGVNAKILYVASVNTWQAYNPFDGYDQNGNWIFKNLYYGPDGSYETRARQVSFNRPFIYTGFDYFEIRFIQWYYKAKANGKFQDLNIEIEFCTSVDLHENLNNFVGNYKLILSIGHDEYWSWEMRDTIENFVKNGGNVAFFSGNVCWWQVRLADDEQNNHFRTMICYKEIQQPDGTYSPGEDPYLTSPPPQNQHTTCNWFNVLPNRPENVMTGVSYYWGTALLGGYSASYVARLHKHWLLKNTELAFGDTFGGALFSGMFETDASDFEDNDRGFPIPSGKNAYGFSAPKDLVILATADLSHIGDNHQGPDFGYWSGPNYHNGWGTIGIFRKPAAVTNGFVFHGGNYNWAYQGLGDYLVNNNWNEFCSMTKNVFEILSIDFQPQAFLLDNSDFELGSLSGWEQKGNGQFSIASPGYDSSNCVKIDASNNSGLSYLSQKYIPVRTNRPYRIKCFAKPDNGVLSSKSISIRLETLDVNNKPDIEFLTATYPISGTDWLELSAEGSFTLSNNADIMVQVMVKLQVDNNQSAYFDNVIVEEMP